MKTFNPMQKMRKRFSEPEELRAFMFFSWHLLLVCAVLIMLGVFLYGGWQLYVVMSDVSVVQANATSKASQNPPIDSGQVDAVLQGFANKKAQFDANKISTTTVADPAQ